ncbi:MAG: hypothetical protein CMQ53_04920 [Gammaproteobacteria bacterium]|nr:hypothetical protein [Gammaproteobacteria bacterium]
MSAPQIIEIGLQNKGTESISLSDSTPSNISLNVTDISPPKKSVNFGPGAEMLMNQKKVSSPKSDLPIADINSLDISIEKEKKPSASQIRNNVLSNPGILKTSSSGANLPALASNSSRPTFIKPLETKPILKEAKKPTDGKTWDGFTKFNDIPVNPDSKPVNVKPMSSEEMLKQKLLYLRKLEALEKKGIQLTKKYNMDSPLAEMKGEYEMIKSEKEKGNSVKFQGKMMMAFVSAVEYLNGKFDPFDIKLDGWSESINENIDEYDEIFGELHEKYGGSASLAPELKLLFMMGGSAAMCHMTNTMFKSSIPGMDDIMRQNPELMQQFTQAAASSMQQNNPGFSGFMNGVMGGGPPPMRMPPSMNRGPPPNMRRGPPVGAYAPRGSPPGPPANMRNRSTRPDIDAARNNTPMKKSARKSRPEMKGPSDINDLLSGIKKKTVNIQMDKTDRKSTVSVEDIRELNPDSLDLPRKSRRKPKSERNTMTLNF